MPELGVASSGCASRGGGGASGASADGREGAGPAGGAGLRQRAGTRGSDAGSCGTRLSGTPGWL
jgi:hypothetical protein